MGSGAFIEPAVVLILLFGGTWINRNTSYGTSRGERAARWGREDAEDSPGSALSPSRLTPLSSDDESSSFLKPHMLPAPEPAWRRRKLRLLPGLGAAATTHVTSPNTRVFRNRALSRLLRRFPFLVEAWYWALIYWVYQLGRAFTAVTLVESTVDVARQHALQLIRLEQSLHLFWELPVQRAFMRHPWLMHWTNRVYSFIHIPGTIAFLVWLYYFTTTRNRVAERQRGKEPGAVEGSPAGPALYEARRRTMAVCNLIAFVVFTLWPCMPPRLLSDGSVVGEVGDEARSFGFVDTVHGAEGESSVWTQNKFCNQYAAMPSLHFGYSLLIGLTIMSIPLPPHQNRRLSAQLLGQRLRLPSARRLLLVALGVAYPLTILLAIIATANHFVLDAVAGALVCAAAWNGNAVLLNLLPLEDYFLWCLRIHKPENRAVDWRQGQKEDDDSSSSSSADEKSWEGKGVLES